MYQYISSMAKAIDGGDEWESTNISNTPLNTLFTIYSRIIVILSNQYIDGDVAVDLQTIVPSLVGSTLTINDFLIQNDNKVLQAMDHIPSFKKQYAVYSDAIKAGYSITPCNPFTSLTSNQLQSDKHWLFMTKDKVDYSLFHDHCLVNVNGFFHITDTDGNGIYVVDGMKSVVKSNDNNVGIYSFANVGKLKSIPIKEDMVYKQIPTQQYRDHAFINLGVDITNKTLMLVLGGYLHILDTSVMTVINETSIRIDLSNVSLLDRYFESNKYLDFSSLPLSKIPRNDNQIDVNEFFSDENILAYLTLSQSFIVVLDNIDISINKSPVQNNICNGMFVSYEKPEFPLVVQAGKIINYWSVFEDNQWSLTCVGSSANKPLYDTVDVRLQNSVDSANLTTNPFVSPHAYFLKVHTVKT